ncbi:MAG: alpha/beta hydrolase [Muribaculaceae bacterium]|nr:alpha/beta hydrolase [Muribaculaceae bacterium]
MRKFILFLMSFFAIGCIAGDFYTTWDWEKPYKGEKFEQKDTAWQPDILEGYECRFVNQGEAFDGPCRSTIIRKRCNLKSRRGFLYVHGFNDYFFQSEMGDRFVDSGYHFYAVDLRRYGRSRLPWQYPFNVRNQNEYFADIDSALTQMRRDGIEDITLGGHSTGGLTVTLYAAEKGSEIGVDRVVTDSPFLAWNFSPFMRKVAIPTVSFFGGLFKNSKIKQSKCDGYAYSLLKEYDGYWTYNTNWKMIYSPPVTMSWIRAITKAQKRIKKRRENICVPLLVMHSSRKIDGCNFTPEFMTGDAVLDPFAIQQIGVTLGRDKDRTVVCAIDSGLHDLILSRPRPREAAYDTIFKFIRTFTPDPD